MRHVIVNGVPVVTNGQPVDGVTPGRRFVRRCAPAEALPRQKHTGIATGPTPAACLALSYRDVLSRLLLDALRPILLSLRTLHGMIAGASAGDKWHPPSGSC